LQESDSTNFGGKHCNDLRLAQVSGVLFYIFEQFRLEASDTAGGGRHRRTLVWLRAAFTRLLPSSGQPLYGWLAKSDNSQSSPLQRASGSEFNSNLFHLQSLPSWLEPEGKPVKTGLNPVIVPIDKPAVKRLAFNLDTSRVNAGPGQTFLQLPTFQSALPRTLIPAHSRPRKTQKLPRPAPCVLRATIVLGHQQGKARWQLRAETSLVTLASWQVRDAEFELKAAPSSTACSPPARRHRSGGNRGPCAGRSSGYDQIRDSARSWLASRGCGPCLPRC
jgi:hypothetical protein